MLGLYTLACRAVYFGGRRFPVLSGGIGKVFVNHFVNLVITIPSNHLNTSYDQWLISQMGMGGLLYPNVL